jgi:hypothetical protein
MLRHGIEAGPNVLPAVVGVDFGALLGFFDDWTAMAFVVITVRAYSALSVGDKLRFREKCNGMMK